MQIGGHTTTKGGSVRLVQQQIIHCTEMEAKGPSLSSNDKDSFQVDPFLPDLLLDGILTQTVQHFSREIAPSRYL